MLGSEFLHILPASLEWMVLFNLFAIRELADGATIRVLYIKDPIELKFPSIPILPQSIKTKTLC